MNPSVWSKGMYSSSSIGLDGFQAEHLSSFQPDPVLSNVDVSGISMSLHKDNEDRKMLSESAYYRSGDGASSSTNPSKDSTTGHSPITRHPFPPSSFCGHHDWNINSGHQAKRARVENIIKGMTSSPGMHCNNVTTNQCVKSDGMQEKIHDQEDVGTSGFGSQRAGKQLWNQHLSGDEVINTKDEDESPETSPRVTGSYSDFQTSSSKEYQARNKVMNYFQSKPERIELIADVLKYELSRAVSRSVDSIFKSMPLVQTNTEGNAETDIRLQSSVDQDELELSCCGNAEVQVPDVQTEAMSLVVQKPRLENKFVHHHRPQPPILFSNHDSALHEDQPTERIHNTVRQQALRCSQDACSRVGPAKFDTHRNSIKVRSKVNSRSVRSPQTHTAAADPMLMESLCLPHVKIESDCLVKTNLYMLNEGLTTNHLKKAKLMFFYTRYPSSLVLKMCFHDVQFSRCITSQLIKWFSNFREFFYIQMEKFARHALIEGVSDVRGLTVGRQSELFRALNMHYNKANDFQVPDSFLEVAEITLREFYIYISMGKDRDPSWKKAIYKVICKLDSDVPAQFKTRHSA